MAESVPSPNLTAAAAVPTAPALDQGTYEILRSRLATHGAELRSRLDQLNAARQEVFGAITTALVATERITTQNNCIPRDMIPVGGGRFIFGYNVHLGLRAEVQLADVFAVYEFKEHRFAELPLDSLADPQFETDFKNLYRYYKHAVFAKFTLIGPHLFMEFRVGQSVTDIKTFKWLCADGQLRYLGNRFDHEYSYPPQHEFEWTRTHRELHRHGLHPHISIEERLFVECTGGDLTIKVEDNTATGEGIYAEPVEQRDQTLDDAEIFYAAIGSLILLKVRPYQEKAFRYFVFNEKLKQVRRIDAIADSCVLLPDGHGIIFARGYYLQSGEFKLFETELTDMVFHKRIPSPNGEDVLFTFYNRESGHYVLFSYNIIARTVETPIICGGFSIFDNGETALFRRDPEAQRHHAIQIWQTPYVGAAWQPAVRKDSYLFKLGNAALVRGMAECQAVLTLIGKDDSYAGLYLDLVKRSTDVIDSCFWLDRVEVFDLKAPLVEIRNGASAALAEFDKVVNLRRSATAEVARVTGKAKETLRSIATEKFSAVEPFVHRLAELRTVRGELISLREVRYADVEAVNRCEQDVAEAAATLAQRTVEFLLLPDALNPFRDRVATLQSAVPAMSKVTEAKKLEEDLAAAGRELDLLVETVTGLKIQDATETTRIVEAISTIYAVLNQARAGLKNRIRELRGTEAVAEFASQTRLLDQALANYLDLCTTPEKCDESLNRILVQVEELEARFADFDEFVIQLSEKRTALSSAFESRKLELVEARNRKASALLTAAERILKAIRHRAEHGQSLDEINGYFASDAMVGKVRDLVEQLFELGDSVKAEDVQSRLKTIREDAGRQLKDRQDLFAGSSDVIQLGRHQFRINTQELDLTVVNRSDEMCLHITGTNFFEPIADEAFLATRPVWSLETVSETPQIYRAEYLTFQCFEALRREGRLDEAAAGETPAATSSHWTDETCLAYVRQFMASRYREGYVKGVHDVDAARILGALIEMHGGIGLLRYSPRARACASVFWQLFPDGDAKTLLAAKLRGHASMSQLFPGRGTPTAYVNELRSLLSAWTRQSGLFKETSAAEAAEYLYCQLKEGKAFAVSAAAAELVDGFDRHLAANRFRETFETARAEVEKSPPSLFELLREWVGGFAASQSSGAAELSASIDEAAGLLLRGTQLNGEVIRASMTAELQGMAGAHPRLQSGRLTVHYLEFMQRLREHETQVVPVFDRCQALKKDIIEQARARLRLEDFKPRVLTSFVRNRLIDSAYLPLIGDNLAKQIGAAGDAKRTDRMGMLLLVSPPGYGKTTLMEYLASRLGIVFMKINGPAIGHRVLSLDPGEAPNAAAREELNKLNLAFEMGDNVMVCLDDIQHLNPEFLQKFISLCDGQRRIEGVYRGQPRTFDLRGKKVVVVMAGNPYTESGDKFQIPDMLANRADTYNLGDVVGGHSEVFKLSYLENAAASNPVLARLAHRSQKDVHAIIRLAEHSTQEGLDFEGNYAPEELAEFAGVMKKLLRVRDVVLRVNEEYIRSAAQADAYRTEPPFKLQGSYRNMNRLAEKISPVMNEAEIEALLQAHYRNEAQTLTKGAEANLLRFRELTGALSSPDAVRWEEIKKTFRKNLLLHSGDERDPVGQVVRQLSAFYEGLDSIKDVLAAGLKNREADPGRGPSTLIVVPAQVPPAGDPAPAASDVVPATASLPASNGDGVREVRISAETLRKIWDLIEAEKDKASSTRPGSDAKS